MTVEEMRIAKKQLGFTNEMIAEKSGVPLATVQKIFAGKTRQPKPYTHQALEEMFEHAEKIGYYTGLGELY